VYIFVITCIFIILFFILPILFLLIFYSISFCFIKEIKIVASPRFFKSPAFLSFRAKSKTEDCGERAEGTNKRGRRGVGGTVVMVSVGTLGAYTTCCHSRAYVVDCRERVLRPIRAQLCLYVIGGHIAPPSLFFAENLSRKNIRGKSLSNLFASRNARSLFTLPPFAIVPRKLLVKTCWKQPPDGNHDEYVVIGKFLSLVFAKGKLNCPWFSTTRNNIIVLSPSK